MVLSASCFSPQLSFADFDNACINLEHFVDDAIRVKNMHTGLPPIE